MRFRARGLPARCRRDVVRAGALLALACALAVLLLGARAASGARAQTRAGATGTAAIAGSTATTGPGAEGSHWLSLAERGVSMAGRWWNRRRGFYDRRLEDRDRYPLATIWDAVGLFEALSAIQQAEPTAAHRRDLERFARTARTYLDRGLRPVPGFAPYPGDGSARTEVWFDDDAWWGIAFYEAYLATHRGSYLRDARMAFHFARTDGWDHSGGGMWWNTDHPYKSGPALAANALLAALLGQAPGARTARSWAARYLTWGDRHLGTAGGMWANNTQDPSPVDYIEGTMIYAREILCQEGEMSWCAGVSPLAQFALHKFGVYAPQYDAIYDHWMLALAEATGNAPWADEAIHEGQLAEANAANAEGLWLNGWAGGALGARVTETGMLQTQGATSELFGWLALYAPAGG